MSAVYCRWCDDGSCDVCSMGLKTCTSGPSKPFIQIAEKHGRVKAMMGTGAHGIYVWANTGMAVRRANGSAVGFPCTPSSQRTLRKTESELRSLGAIPKPPPSSGQPRARERQGRPLSERISEMASGFPCSREERERAIKSLSRLAPASSQLVNQTVVFLFDKPATADQAERLRQIVAVLEERAAA